MQPGSRWEVLGHRERQLFSGGLAGYRVFRIPVLVRAGRALLAFAEEIERLRRVHLQNAEVTLLLKILGLLGLTCFATE